MLSVWDYATSFATSLPQTLSSLRFPPAVPHQTISHTTVASEMSGLFTRVAGVSGAASIILGAYGAHVLRDTDIDERRKKAFDTASRYHLMHSIALLGARQARFPMLTAGLMVGGILIFCGPCYHYSISGDETLRKYTPTEKQCVMIDDSEVEVLDARDDFLNRSQEILEQLSSENIVPDDILQKLDLPSSATDDVTKFIRNKLLDLHAPPRRSPRLSLSPNRPLSDLSPGDLQFSPFPVFTSTPMIQNRKRKLSYSSQLPPPRLDFHPPSSPLPNISFLSRIRNLRIFRGYVNIGDVFYLLLFFSCIIFIYIFVFPINPSGDNWTHPS